MTTLQKPPADLRSKVQSLAMAIRRRLALLGFLTTLLPCVSAGLLLALLDYLWHFPGPLRLAIDVIFIVAVVAALAIKVIRPIFRTLPRGLLARQLEKTGRLSHDEIYTALEFVETGLPERNALAARTVLTAQNAAAAIRLDDALSWRLITRYTWLVLAVVVVAAAIVFTAPRLAGISGRRWLHPLSPNHWPLSVVVQLDWPPGGPPAILPRGDPFTVAARVTRGFSPELRVWLDIKTANGKRHAQLMTWQGKAAGDVFQKVILPTSNKIAVRVVAGDDARNPWVNIVVVPRPKIVTLTGIIHPPAYAPDAPVYSVNLRHHSARIILGSTLDIRVAGDRPIVAANITGAASAGPIHSLMKATAHGVPSLQFSCRPAKAFAGRIAITSVQHLASERGGRFRVAVSPDGLPQVQITHPRYAMDLTPNALIHLHISASDDLGLTTLDIAGGPRGQPSTAPPSYIQKATWQTLRFNQLTHQQIGKAIVAWTPQSMHLKPGDTIDLFAQVRDNFRGSTRPYVHPIVDSPRLVITIRTAAQIQRELRRSLGAIRRSIKRLLRRERITRNQTRLLHQTIEQAHELTPTEKLLLAQLAQRQNREALSAQAITHELGNLTREAHRNKLSKTSVGRLITTAGRVMHGVGYKIMPRAQNHLTAANRSVQASRPIASGPQLFSAQSREEQAIDQMRALIAKLGAAGEFESLRHQTERLLTKQNLLHTQLKQIAKQTLGQKVSKLSSALKRKLASLSAQQKTLAKLAARLSSRLSRAASQMAKSNPHMSAALKQAAQIAARYSVADAMSMASAAAGGNQLQSASADQKQAATGLAKMVRVLNQQAKRSLAQQVHRLKSLIEQLEALIKEQALLTTASAAEPPNSTRATLMPLADQQSKLELRSAQLAGKSRRVDASGYAHAYLMGACHQMGRATASLENARQPLAIPHQLQATHWLKKALAVLQKALAKDRGEQQMQTLSGLKAIYVRIRSQQHQMRLESKRLMAEMVPGKPPTRLQILNMAGESQGETALIKKLGQVSLRIGSRAPVITWMNRGIAKAMRSARSRLDQANPDAILLADQALALSQLDAVIEALTNQMKAISGGGGGGGGGNPPLIPPAAQLKLLRILQLQVNLQTLKLHAALARLPAGPARTSVRQQIEILANQQSRLHKQAVKMVESMQHH